MPRIDYTQDNNFGGLGWRGGTQGEPVSVLTIDSLQLPHLDLLKADVEGMEQAVLEGRSRDDCPLPPNSLRRKRPPGEVSRITRVFAAHGLRCLLPFAAPVLAE